MPHPSTTTSTLRALVGCAALTLLAAAPVPAQAESPVTVTPEVRKLSIPTVSEARQHLVAAAGERSAGRVVAALDRQSTSRFSTLGVTWARTTQSAPQVEVRVRTRGDWSPWTLLDDESDSGPDGQEALKARPGTAPIWVGDSDGVAVRVLTSAGVRNASAPDDLSVALVNPKSSPVPTAPRAAAQAITPTLPKLTGPPTVVSRAAWGADERLRSFNGADCAQPKYTSTIKAAIVHHTAGVNDYTAASSASQVRGMYAFHVKGRGWCDLGYNFLVDRFGTVFEGRFGGIAAPVHGAHATLWNTDTVGVSLMGNFETARPTAAMLASTAKVVAWKLEGNYRSATGKVTLAGKSINRISTHGDVMSTACPGVHMQARMPDLRVAVSAKIGSYNTPIFRRWQALGGEAGWVGSPVIGEHVLGAGRRTRFTNADLFSNASGATYWVKGSNRSRYRALGETGHALGWPTSDQVAGVLGSQVNRFVGGAIYHTPATGSQAIYWAFYRHYVKSTAVPARLGLPTASQKRGTVAGSRVQTFTKGGLFWTSALETQEVNGQIYERYRSLGSEASRLGMPTRGDYAIAVGRATDFQGGRITWNATTKQTVVRYS